MNVTIISNQRLPFFALTVPEDVTVHQQIDTGRKTAIIWSQEGPESILTSDDLNTTHDMPTSTFSQALPVLASEFGLNIPCVQG